MSDFAGWLGAAVWIGGVYWLLKQRVPARPASPPRPAPPPPSAPPPVPRPPPTLPLPRTGPGAPRVTAELTAGIRDGLTGETIKHGQQACRCTRCHTAYHEESHATLQTDNAGQCLSCSATTFEQYTTAAVDGLTSFTARVCWVGAAAEPGFFVALLDDKPWRQARKLIFPPAFTSRRSARGFIASLANQEVTVRGSLASDGPLGPRIVVTRRDMVRPNPDPKHPHRSR